MTADQEALELEISRQYYLAFLDWSQQLLLL